MEKSIIILVIMLSLNLKAQIKDGAFIEVPQGYCNGAVIIEIQKDSIKKCEYSVMGKDSTVGIWEINRDFLSINWNRKPKSSDQIRAYNNPNAFNSNDFAIIFYDQDNNHAPGVTVIEEGKPLGSTDIAGRFSISKKLIPKKLKFTFVGYQSIELNCDTLGVNNLDSMVIRMKFDNKRYHERPNEKFSIRDINERGFELFEYNRYIQYLRLDFFNKLRDSGVLLRKAHFTEEEYADILKY